MVNRPVAAFVLVNYRKRWAGNRIGNTQGLAHRFDECGFACPHIAVKQKYACILGKLQYLCRCFRQIGCGCGM